MADLGSTLRLTERATNAIGTSRIASLRTVAVVAPEARSLALLLRTLVPIPGSRMAIRVRCALDRPGIRTCEAVIRHGRTVLTRAAASAASHTAASVIVRLPVTAALRRVAARPPGSAVTLTASATQDAHGGTWSKTRTLLAAPSTALTVPSRSIFGRTRAHFRPTAALWRLRAAVADASSLICTGHTAATADPVRDVELGLVRARAVCAWLASGRKLTTLARSSGSYRPVASNVTIAGRARNARITIQVGYWRPDPAVARLLHGSRRVVTPSTLDNHGYVSWASERRSTEEVLTCSVLRASGRLRRPPREGAGHDRRSRHDSHPGRHRRRPRRGPQAHPGRARVADPRARELHAHPPGRHQHRRRRRGARAVAVVALV